MLRIGRVVPVDGDVRRCGLGRDRQRAPVAVRSNLWCIVV